MGVVGAIKAMGRAFKKLGKILISHKVIKAAKTVAVFIPSYGVPIGLALEFVEEAEDKFSKPGSGTEKFAFVLKKLKAGLKKAGIEEKRISAIIEMALLVLKDEAFVIVDKPDSE